MKVWKIKPEFHQWAFDMISGLSIKDSPEVGSSNNWTIFTKFANEVATELLGMNLFKETSQAIEFVNVNELEVNQILIFFAILPCYAIMPYSKVMTKEDFMSSLYKNRMNLTIEVLDLCLPAFVSVRNQLK